MLDERNHAPSSTPRCDAQLSKPGTSSRSIGARLQWQGGETNDARRNVAEGSARKKCASRRPKARAILLGGDYVLSAPLKSGADLLFKRHA